MIGHMSQTPPAGESNEMFVAIDRVLFIDTHHGHVELFRFG